MLSWLILLLVRKTDMLSSLPILRPFSTQVKSIGKSPFVMLQVKDAASPEFRGLSENSKAAICGGTAKQERTQRNFISLVFLWSRQICRVDLG